MTGVQRGVIVLAKLRAFDGGHERIQGEKEDIVGAIAIESK